MFKQSRNTSVLSNKGDQLALLSSERLCGAQTPVLLTLPIFCKSFWMVDQVSKSGLSSGGFRFRKAPVTPQLTRIPPIDITGRVEFTYVASWLWGQRSPKGAWARKKTVDLSTMQMKVYFGSVHTRTPRLVSPLFPYPQPLERTFGSPNISSISLLYRYYAYTNIYALSGIRTWALGTAEEMNKTKNTERFLYLQKKHEKISKKLGSVDTRIAADVISDCDIVFCTLTSASSQGPLKYVQNDHFDVCIIDECSQAIEAACWIPLLLVKKCILAGDHFQLPPTILCKQASNAGLKVTLMERLLKLYGDSIKIMLTIQYRMNEVIMKYPSKHLYDNKLEAHESVRSWLLKDLQGIMRNATTTTPLLLIDTAGCNMHETQSESNGSKGNEGEADLVYLHVNKLIKSGLNPADIAIITPYKLQVDLIKSRLGTKYPGLEINSVDGFQGREKEAVVLSLVRSNGARNVGFLAEDRRVNVAITRAKRHLAIVCDKKTMSGSRVLKSFLKYCVNEGEVRTAFQYQKEMSHDPNMKSNICAEIGSMLRNINILSEEVYRFAKAMNLPLELVKNLEVPSVRSTVASPLMHPVGESCVSEDDIGCLHIINGTMNARKYIDTILEPKLLPSVKDLFPNNAAFIFQQDSAPSYTVK
ncbi:DNA-binding protein SMUBP-2 [Trichonephila clavipes]|nr:DNA-binding protein SMUBP-2 [Trichonephila clavipes]